MIIDWITVLAQAINFLVLVWLLNRFLFKPILKVVAEREQKICKEIRDAKIQSEEAQKAKESLTRDQEKLVTQRDEYLATTLEDAKKEKNSLLQKAQADCDSLRQTFQDNLQSERETVFLDMRNKLEEALFHIAKKVLKDITGASFEESAVHFFIHKLDELTSKEMNEILVDTQNFSNGLCIKSAFKLFSTSQLALENAVRTHFGKEVSPRFEIDPELVCGLELTTSGHKVSWNISEYISLIQDSICNR